MIDTFTCGALNLFGFMSFIQNSIRTALMDSLVWPSRIVVPMIPGGDFRYMSNYFYNLYSCIHPRLNNFVEFSVAMSDFSACRSFHHQFDFWIGCCSFLELHPVGELEVKLIEAKNIKNTDLIGKADPFVTLFVRQTKDKVKRSTSKSNTLRPVWNEDFKIEVKKFGKENSKKQSIPPCVTSLWHSWSHTHSKRLLGFLRTLPSRCYLPLV